MHQFHDANRHLPPPKLGTTPTNTLGSTLVVLLPYLEEFSRFAAYDLTKKVSDQENVTVTSQPLGVYLCPSMQLPRAVPECPCEMLGPGSYMISAGTQIVTPSAPLDGAFDRPNLKGNYSLSYQQILDGTSKTLLVGENNYGLDQYVWETCSAVNGTTRWGDQTWASGYWFNAWGHISWNLYESSGLRHTTTRRLSFPQFPPLM